VIRSVPSFTFVTDGVEAALEQARAAVLEELQIHVVPLLLGGGVRLFDHLGVDPVELELDRVIESPSVTHLRYRPAKGRTRGRAPMSFASDAGLSN
jgi:hypothetical protein